ncbi:OmpP1/FadL family transporter [Desulfovibrio gilichinskyi]|uniref:Long-chain fatty acid transport protein n=1 Tax=Desulfovibrio gilichinskyi TaxID=1519643 RepID=A0A1X7CBV1_9BACT|nr:OmpP1/FadL family transporter [Desulfovibrio gilichinskyi]SME93197.1 long-chain fatty acid transport protein [Desulfovibrio gilichinskyi]
MKNKFTVYVGILLCVIGVTLSSGLCKRAEASGFALYEWSARGNALGGAMIARADDPSAIAWNAAGMTQLNGTQVLAGVSGIAIENDLTTTYNGNTQSASTKDKIYVPPHSYFTHQLNDKFWFGIGTFTRYGLGTTFSEDWAGRYSSYSTELNSFSINPNLAYKYNDYISFSLGLELMYVRADLRKKFDPTGANDPDDTSHDIDQRLIVDGISPGFNAGLRITPCDEWAIGFSYRSKMLHHADGSASYNLPAGMSPTTLFNDSAVTMSMNTPNMFFFGLEYKPIPNFSVEADAIYSEWSEYSDITYHFDKSTAIGRKNVTVNKKWEDVWRFQFGVEYLPIENLALRAGYVYDQSPIREGYEDYMLPTNDRQIVSTGFGVTFDKLVVDVSYMYLWMKDRDIKARAGTGVLDTSTKNGQSHVVGLSLGYNF